VDHDNITAARSGDLDEWYTIGVTAVGGIDPNATLKKKKTFSFRKQLPHHNSSYRTLLVRTCCLLIADVVHRVLQHI
jgi:hypothetical protein